MHRLRNGSQFAQREMIELSLWYDFMIVTPYVSFLNKPEAIFRGYLEETICGFSKVHCKKYI